jgi:O-antigen/teichoic acid export membrane protein
VKLKASTVQRVAKNTVILLAASIAAQALNFLFQILAARYLGVEDYGVLTYAVALTGILFIVFEMGLNVIITRELARDVGLTGKYIGNLSIMRLFLSILFFATVALYLYVTGFPGGTRVVVYLLTLSTIMNSFSLMIFSAFRAREIISYEAVYNLSTSCFLLLGALVVVSYKWGVAGFAAAFLIVNSVFLLYSITIFRWKSAKVKFEIDWHFWKDSLKEAWPMGVMAIFVILYFRIDVVMLSLMKGDSAVGIYGISYRISEALTVFPSMLLYALFPVSSKFHETSRHHFEIIYQRAIKLMLIIALPSALSITLLAKPLVSALYGAEYIESAACLQVLIWAAAIMFITMALGNALVAANKQKITMLFAILSAILNIVLNALLIPAYSYIGASVATVVTEFMGLVFGFSLLYRYGYKMGIARLIAAPLFGMSITLIVVVILLLFGVNTYVIAGVSLTLYFVIIGLFGVNKDDRRVIKSIFHASDS